jgi:outer membrane protein TolC
MALDQAKENYRMTNLQYQHQLATTTNVLDARAFLSQAMTNYYGALYGYLIAEAELERVAGGSLS